ncbi:hypothetical protein GCM10017674_71300 [Streptomyces gardneri]|uniref:Uncharacterized protein n=1 Tax=Streptomyces gardneri TaxID=66892 RepID=A0A4Y3REF0_9ACTN|nr:hypothetical protein SGA01_13440 [Streptomyces gardneri]GHH18918.1 hypothetical protein GCM10017674_71300 [Streptomyces gardneri]
MVEDVGVGVEGVVGGEVGQGLGDPCEGVVRGVDETGAFVEGADAGGQVTGVGADAVRGSPDRGDGPVAGRRCGQPRGDEEGGVASGQLAGGDAAAGHRDAADAYAHMHSAIGFGLGRQFGGHFGIKAVR